ncbi:MAG TPA: B12-binding domain-containing radical SAM protein, partial [Chryseolinea sp.]|nr:B12-binding domain-containing radical SAM protein [Chryseolinea sp.]
IEATQTTKLDWSTSTDRQVDFKRTYSRKYYDFAVKRVINEVNYFKVKDQWSPISAAKLKAKSLAAKLGMKWSRYAH